MQFEQSDMQRSNHKQENNIFHIYTQVGQWKRSSDFSLAILVFSAYLTLEYYLKLIFT